MKTSNVLMTSRSDIITADHDGGKQVDRNMN